MCHDRLRSHAGLPRRTDHAYEPGHLAHRCPWQQAGQPPSSYGGASRAAHSRHRRKAADRPSLGREACIGLIVRRFHCQNAACSRQSFSERLPDLVVPYARRLLLPSGNGGLAVPARHDRTFPRSTSERAADAESQACWQPSFCHSIRLRRTEPLASLAHYDEVWHRQLADETLLESARATGLGFRTVRRYARAESFPAGVAHGPGPSILGSYLVPP